MRSDEPEKFDLWCRKVWTCKSYNVVLAKPMSKEEGNSGKEVECESYRISDMIYDMNRDLRSEHSKDHQIEEKKVNTKHRRRGYYL